MTPEVDSELRLVLDWLCAYEDWAEEVELDSAPTLIYSTGSRAPRGMTRGRVTMSYPRPGMPGVRGPVSDQARAMATSVVRQVDLRDVASRDEARVRISTALACASDIGKSRVSPEIVSVAEAVRAGAHREWETRQVMDV